MAAAAVFVSYSSRDESFALGLRDGLPEHEVWIDSAGLPAGTAFRTGIREAIEASDDVIVVLTPDWLASAECAKELALALDLHKRVIPVEPRRLTDVTLPAALDGLSPIGFWREGGPAAAMEKLRHDLVADHDWICAQRDLLVDALRWQRSGGDDIRLRGPALRAAVRLVEQATAGLKSPDLLPVQREYVQACEVAEAAEVERLTTLNQRAVARHLASEAQRTWAANPLNVGLALRLLTESLRRDPGGAARSLANQLVRTLPAPVQTLAESAGARIVVFSRDGWRLAIACGPRVQVWQIFDWTRQVDLTLPDRVAELAFDGRALTVLSIDGVVRRIALPNPFGSRRGAGPASDGPEPGVSHVDVRTAVLSANGRYVAWARSDSVLVQRVDAADRPPRRFDFPLRPDGLALSPTGRYVLVCAQGRELGADHLTCLIDTTTDTRTSLSDKLGMDPCFSPDGRFVAVREHGGTTVWSVPDASAKRTMRGDLAAWFPDSATAICHRERILRIDEPPVPRHELLEWDAESGELSHLLWVADHPYPLRAFNCRQRRMVAFASARGVRVVDVRLGTATAIVPQSRDTFSPSIAVSPRDLLATVSASDPLQVFDLAPENPRSIGPFDAAIGVAVASRQGRWIARSLNHACGSDYGSLPEPMDEPGPQVATTGRVRALAVSDIGSFAAITTATTTISATGVARAGVAALVVAGVGGVTEWPRVKAGRSVAISPDARWVAEIADDGAVALADTAVSAAGPVALPVGGATAVEFDDTSSLLLVSGPGRIAVFDGQLQLLSRQDVAGACFTREERPRLCVCDSAGRAVVLALPTGRELARWSLSFMPGLVRACGPAGGVLAVDDRTIVAVDLDTGRQSSRMDHLDAVRTIVPSPSGRYLLSETVAGRSAVWDVASSTQVFDLDEARARAVWLSGDRLAVVRGNRFDVEPVSVDELIAEARSRGGELSRGEWQTYLPDERWPGRSSAITSAAGD